MNDVFLPLEDEILSRKPPPLGQQLERIEFLARILAYGALQDIWSPRLVVKPRFESQSSSEYGDYISWEIGEEWGCRGHENYDKRLKRYIKEIWGNLQPQASFLQSFGYLEWQTEYGSPSTQKSFTLTEYLITPKAFNLLDKPLDKSVFVSYKRSESSAFALLLHNQLLSEGFDAFVDMRGIPPGEKWLSRIDQEISASDVFVCLIGKSTLESENVIQEIKWAMEKDILAIPIWHNGYIYQQGSYPEIAEFLDERNAIIVENENVLAYDGAVRQLMQFLQQPFHA